MFRAVPATLVLLAVTIPAIAVRTDGDTDWITDLGGSFKRDRSGQVIEVDLSLTWVRDDDLAKLTAFPELRKIDLSHAKISDLGFAQLRPLKKVTHLICYYCDYLTDGAVAYLKHWENLESLNMRGTEVTGRVFDHLAGMKRLKTLDVGFSRVNDDGFDPLSALESLEELHIGGNKMSGLALPLLRLLPSLKNLDVNGSQRTDSGRWGLMLTDVNVESIAALTQLEVLNMGGAIVSDVGMFAIEKLVNLHTLDVSRMEITAKGLDPLTRLPELRRLNLYQATRIDDSAAEFIAAMKKLEILDLSETAITDAFLDTAERMKQLRMVMVDGTKVSPERVEQFRKRRPDVRIFWAPRYKEVTSEEDTRLTG
ncbi:MAG: leucine-rich repeat domain-containing protein [Bryobacteraceae bacterium]